MTQLSNSMHYYSIWPHFFEMTDLLRFIEVWIKLDNNLSFLESKSTVLYFKYIEISSLILVFFRRLGRKRIHPN